MNKKFLKTLLLGGLMFSFMGVFTACEDYDEEINNLQNQITANSNAIAEIQALLAKGVVIEKVEKNAEGILLTLSDGTTQQITNGADGKDATVWTIGNDGYWYQDGVKTEYKAVGTDGKDGQDGQDGNDGKDGADGKDSTVPGPKGDKGDVYVPNENGFFYLNGEEKTTIQWATAGASAAQTETAVVITNADGTEVTISTVADLMSMVFKPQVVVDGVNAILAGSLTYADGRIICTPEVTAEYHLNPATVKDESIKKNTVKYVWGTHEYYNVNTRALVDVDNINTSVVGDVKNGLLTVKLDVTGRPSKQNEMDLIALQVENAKGAVITSDYVTIYDDPISIEELDIVRKDFARTADAHYWDILTAAKEDAEEETAVKSMDGVTEIPLIVEVPHNSSINLDNHVALCLLNNNSHGLFNQMDKYHLYFKYTKVSWKREANEDGLYVVTDQAEFIDLEGDKVTPKTYAEDNKGQQRSSIGRTPIIKVELMHKSHNGSADVKLDEAYVVLEIIDGDKEYWTLGGEWNFTTEEHFGCYKPHIAGEDKCYDRNFCDDETIDAIKAEDMNQVYYALNMSKEDFEANFKFVAYPNTVTAFFEDGKSVIYGSSNHLNYNQNPGQEFSYGLTWDMTADEIWNLHGTVPAPVKAVYVDYTNKVVVVITINHNGKIPAHKLVDLNQAGEKFKNMWNDELTLGLFNVRVPFETDTNKELCEFHNIINSLYLTGKDPVTLINKEFAKSVYYNNGCEEDIQYIFNSASVNGNATGFTVSNDGLTLRYKAVDVAEIVEGTDSVKLIHCPTTEELVNTNEFKVKFTVRTKMWRCNNEYIDIPSDTKAPVFEVRYVRPINIDKEKVGQFIDGRDFGELNTTVLKAEDVIYLKDWRGEPIPFIASNRYYQYYGIESVTIDPAADVKCEIANYPGQQVALPSTIKAGIVDQNAKTLYPVLATKGYADNEYFYYYNNGTILDKDMTIFFPIKITYWWGSVSLGQVAVKVKATTHIN